MRKKYFFDFSIIPYVRWFFGRILNSQEQAGAGFFIEANGALFSGNNIPFSKKDSDQNNESSFGAGLGLGLGWKYLSRNNWVGEINYGIGLNFVKRGIYPHFGISIGKRF